VTGLELGRYLSRSRKKKTDMAGCAGKFRRSLALTIDGKCGPCPSRARTCRSVTADKSVFTVNGGIGGFVCWQIMAASTDNNIFFSGGRVLVGRVPNAGTRQGCRHFGKRLEPAPISSALAENDHVDLSALAASAHAISIGRADGDVTTLIGSAQRPIFDRRRRRQGMVIHAGRWGHSHRC